MTALDPLRLTARDAKRLLVDGEISSAELTKVYLDQIAAVERKVRAYILVTAGQRRQVLHQGRPRDAGDARPARGPAHRRQGQHGHRGRHHHVRLEDPPQLPAGLHRHRRAPGVGRPRGHARQDQHRRVRHGLQHRELGLPGHRATRGTSAPCPAAAAAAPPPPSPPARRSGRSAPTPAAPSASRPRSAASSA